jgi:hypothetical protein
MYRNIEINGVNYRADLDIVVDHRITIKDGEVSVSADLDGRTPGADFEATFTGRGDTQVLVAPEEYVIGDAVMEPGDDLKIAKATKLAEIANERWKTETGGATVSSMTIMTDRESIGMLNGAVTAAMQDSGYTCNWKTSQGFVTLNAEQIITVATAIREHVQNCFDGEAELTAMVEAAETVEAINAVVWE